MTYQNYTHEQLRRIDAAHHLHPFTDHQALRKAGSRIIARGEGAYIYDVDNRQILDAMAGLWCVNVGYGRRELIDAAGAQLDRLAYYNTFFNTATPTPVLLAQRLAELAPAAIGNVFYGCSGSETNDTVIRMIRHYWALRGQPKRQIIIARELGYHGSTIAAASLGGMEPMHKQLHPPLPGMRHVMPPYRFKHGHPGESEQEFATRAAQAIEEAILAAGPENVAAIVGEPVQGAGGVIIPPPGYWPMVQEIAAKYDVLLGIDEVITGFGRTGHWFASEYFGLTPHIITTAKGITSGYIPLSAALVGERIVDTFVEKGGEFAHGYTYSGHPVACAVALANLDAIAADHLIARVRDDTGPYLLAQLRKAIADHPIVGEVRALGFVGAIELVADPHTKKRFAREKNAGIVCREACIRHNFIMRAVGDTMVFSPPLIWTRAIIDAFVEKLVVALNDTAAELAA